MKNPGLQISILLFLSLILFSCTQNTKEADVDADISAVREVMDRYMLAVNTDDLDLFMTCWADDARRMEPGFDIIVGKENIRSHFKIMYDAFNFHAESYGEIETEVVDNLAFAMGNFILSSSPKEGGSITRIDAKVVDIYKRQTDGSWKIYIDCFNLNPKWTNDPISGDSLKNQDPVL